MRIEVETRFSPGDIVTFAGFVPTEPRQRFCVVEIKLGVVGLGPAIDSIEYYLRGFADGIKWASLEQRLANGPCTQGGCDLAMEHELVKWEPEKSKCEPGS